MPSACRQSRHSLGQCAQVVSRCLHEHGARSAAELELFDAEIDRFFGPFADEHQVREWPL